jgi:hypothetical protein
MDMTPEQHLQAGISSNRSVRMQRESEYLHLARYVRPQHTEWFSHGRNTNTRPTIELLWDSTAIQANDTWARGVNSMSHNPATDWFIGKDRDKRVNENGEASAWYSFLTTDMREVMASGGLYNALLHRLRDVGCYGWGTVYSYQDDNLGHLAFEYVPAPESFFTLNRDGSCRGHWRPENLTAQEVNKRGWLEKSDVGVQNAFRNNDQHTKFLYWHIVLDKDEAPTKGTGKHDYVGYHFQDSPAKIIDEHGFHEMPYHVLTWDPVPQSPYPTGIGYITLPEIRNINAQRKKFDRILDVESDSPILATSQDETQEYREWQPGERIYGGISGDGRRLMDPLFKNPNGSRQLRDEVQYSREVILEAWHNNLMMMVTSHQMTAQEVASRDEKIIQAMGPFIIPMFLDLKKLCERVFHSRMRAGIYDPMPAIFDADTEVQFEFVGILAKAMKKLTAGNITMFISEVLGTVGQYDPEEVKASIDSSIAIREMGDARALPAGLVRSKDQREARLAEEQAAQQNMQMMAAAPGLAKAAKDGAQAMNEMGGGGGGASNLALAP